MSDVREFSFDDDSIASAYDNMLVPILFQPWAAQLIADNQPWEDKRVLDLATGTGIVAQQLSGQVGPSGQVIGVDINSQMLTLAAKRCAGSSPAVKFIESPAHPMNVASNSIDFVVCQQGFQFFPDKQAAAQEIYRVLCDHGRVVITTWCPVEECQFFGAICDALNAIGKSDIANMMRVPFDHLPESALISPFQSAGFADVELRRQEQDFVVDGGMSHAIKIVYSTPIGPKLRELPDDRQSAFQKRFTSLIGELSPDGITMGRMVSNLLSAKKPTRTA